MLVEYSDVALLCDVKEGNPAYGGVEFRCGDIGILVDTLDGSEAAIVEFIAEQGHTLDVTPLTQADVRHLESDDIQHVRPLHWGGNDLAPEPYGECRFATPEKSAHIVLTRPVPELALLPGDLGVVVDGGPAARQYRIKMAVGPERNGPVITLPAEAIRLPHWYELPTVRKLQPPAPAG